jgi:hypothetical protein
VSPPLDKLSCHDATAAIRRFVTTYSFGLQALSSDNRLKQSMMPIMSIMKDVR